MPYVIVSECERGFWSNQYGWVSDRSSASVFPNADNLPLPLQDHHEGKFIDVALAPEFYLDEPLVSGDVVTWDDDEHDFGTVILRVELVKTRDGCARTSEDMVVLRDALGSTTESYARSLMFSPSLGCVHISTSSAATRN